jgi:hypothetical protein
MKIEKLALYGILGYFAYKFLFKKTANTNTGDVVVAADVPDGGTNKSLIDETIRPEPLLGGIRANNATAVGSDKKYYFRYAGSSALRSINGQRVNCGKPGNPYTSAGVEGRFAKNGFAPTTYFAVLELGSKAAIMEGYREPNANVKPNGQLCVNVGDQLLLQVVGGQFSAMDSQIVRVLQVGTDACTNSGAPELMNSGIVVDFPIILEGADDAQYPAQDAIGYFSKI